MEKLGSVPRRWLWCEAQRCVFVSALLSWCLCVRNGGHSGGKRECELQSTEQKRLLSRGSASRVCCWPDQLAVCLAGVWHITTKGFGQTGDCTVLIYPPIWLHLHLFPPLSVLSCGMHRANVEVWFFRKVKCNTAYRIPTILYSLQCDGTPTGLILQTFLHAHFGFFMQCTPDVVGNHCDQSLISAV